MEDVLEGLNEAQREAVTETEGCIRVIAGAGSGKTRALTHRFAYLVNELGVMPGGILCVTFTNKAANEMRQRIHLMTGDNDTGYINTFHGFCVNILQEDSHAISYPKSFMVIDNADIDDMLKLIYEERGLSLRDKTFGQARDMFEMRKCVTEPGYFLDMVKLPVDKLREKYLAATEVNDILFYGYLYQERKTFSVDYNDLIILSLYIFQEHPDIALKWQKRLEYIMIDEFQDIDPLQYRLMEVLESYHRNLFIVGDPDQTIYTWRGANVRYLLDFDQHFAGTKTIMMMENYRSTPEILSVANSLIEKNKLRMEKALVPKRNLGIRRMKALEDYQERNGGSLYEALQANVEDELFHGTGAKDFIEMIEKFAASYHDQTISEVLTAILQTSGYETMLRTEGSQERLDNLAELKQSVYDYETTAGEETDLDSYLRSVAMYSNMDLRDQTDRVKLMTVHTAKGLEFPYVFLCGMSEGIFPSRKIRTLESMEEERRLAFVAVTRAEKGLYISEAAGRNFDGSPRYPSRFVLDIDPTLMHFTETPKAAMLDEAKSYYKIVDAGLRSGKEPEHFAIGDRIAHKAFGCGTIKDVDLDASSYTIQFDDMPTERRISFRVKLQKLKERK